MLQITSEDKVSHYINNIKQISMLEQDKQKVDKYNKLLAKTENISPGLREYLIKCHDDGEVTNAVQIVKRYFDDIMDTDNLTTN